MERLVRFKLIGLEFAFYTSAPEDEVNEIIKMVTDLVEENRSSGTSGSVAVGKVAVLASLNIASRYVELKRSFKDYKRETESRLVLLGKRISEEIEEEKKLSAR